MFTSRAEYRLSLRADNADQRLTQRGIDIGCVGGRRKERFDRKMNDLEVARGVLKEMNATPNAVSNVGVKINKDGKRRNGLELLSFKGVTLETLKELWPDLPDFASGIGQQVQNDAMYANYIQRQNADVQALQRDEQLRIPIDFEFDGLPGLSNELQKKLLSTMPETLGQASRIDGMTPAALTLLLGRIKQFNTSNSV